jgi:hypothetical protein
VTIKKKKKENSKIQKFQHAVWAFHDLVIVDRTHFIKFVTLIIARNQRNANRHFKSGRGWYK